MNGEFFCGKPWSLLITLHATGSSQISDTLNHYKSITSLCSWSRTCECNQQHQQHRYGE